MATAIKPQPGIMDIALYQCGASTVDGQSNVLKLSSNENPNGPSDKAKEAYARAALDLHRYPSSDHSPLRTAIGDVWGVDPERVICGVGSDEILHFMCQAYAGPGDEVIVPPLTAVATAAVRDASDGPEFCDQVLRECGLKIHVIDGEEEARLSAQGDNRTGVGSQRGHCAL